MEQIGLAIAYEALYQRYYRSLSYNFRRYMRRRTFVLKGLAMAQWRAYETCEGLLT